MINTVKILGLLASLCGCSSTYSGVYVPVPAYAAYSFDMKVASGVVGSGETHIAVARVNAANEAHCWQIADTMERGANGKSGIWMKPLSCLAVEE